MYILYYIISFIIVVNRWNKLDRQIVGATSSLNAFKNGLDKLRK